MNGIGLDLSLTAPGVAYDNHPRTLSATSLQGAERLSFRAHQIIDLLVEARPHFAVLEGYAYGGKKAAGARSIGELGGVVRWILHERGIPFAVVPPTTLKRYATGKGNADKSLVIRAALENGAEIPQRRGKGGVREYDDNAADAWWLRQMGLARYVPTHPQIIQVPTEQKEALFGATWPQIRKGKS